MLNRVTQLLGVEHPIIQAPMGYIARAQLASAVSNAGALGIIETSSGQLDQVRDEIAKMRDLTDKPFGVNIAQLLVRDPGIVDFVHDQGVRFVTTSAGDPTGFTDALHDAGITVFHVVPNLHSALKAIAAGVDGIVAEGGEGGGFKTRATWRRWCSCRSSARASTCRSSRPAASVTGAPWPPRSRWVPRACRWARAWCRPRSHRCTTTTSSSSSTRPRPAP